MKPALIIAAHGSHLSATAAPPAWAHRAAIAAGGLWSQVECAFWKEEPALSRVLDGIPPGPVVVAPFFIANGYFVQEVIPRELGLEAGRSSGRSPAGHDIRIAAALGDHPDLAAIAAQRAREAGAMPGDAVAILGHGTPRNPNSEKNTYRQVEFLRETGDFAEVLAVFLDQEPRMTRVFALATARRVVVVPLFVADGWHAGESIPEELGVSPGGSTADGARELRYALAVGTHPGVPALLESLALEALP